MVMSVKLERIHQQKCAKEARHNRDMRIGYVAIHPHKGLLMGFGKDKKPVFLEKEIITENDIQQSAPVWFHPEYYFNHIAYANPDLSDCIFVSTHADNVDKATTKLSNIFVKNEDNSIGYHGILGKHGHYVRGWSSHLLNAIADMDGGKAPELDLSGYIKPNVIATARHHFKHSAVGKILHSARYHFFNITHFGSISKRRNALMVK